MIRSSYRVLVVLIATILSFGLIAVAVDPNDHVSVYMLNRVRAQQAYYLRRHHLFYGTGEYEHITDYNWNSLPNFQHDAWQLAQTTGVVPVTTHQRQVGETLGIFGRPRLPIIGDTSAFFYSIIPSAHPLGQRMGLRDSIASVLWKHHNGYEQIVHVDIIRDRGWGWPLVDMETVFRYL
ncbi:uncharacterized protein UTRI_10374_B [Ustilago trichophora]|uniref:Uncharacterized protein n=1 Tax=Ustilago trichophora TaxID=86804 RepID=A0A5C3EB89_9BASI|nr:uncharacterized protein UTRI_10374_B [Ustilago trichophora]